MFQPLTKDHGDDNHLAVTSAGSGGSQDLGRRPEMASAGFAMDRFVPNKKDSAKYFNVIIANCFNRPSTRVGVPPGTTARTASRPPR